MYLINLWAVFLTFKIWGCRMIFYEFLKWAAPNGEFPQWRKYPNATLEEALHGLENSKRYRNTHRGFVIDSNGKVYKEWHRRGI